MRGSSSPPSTMESITKARYRLYDHRAMASHLPGPIELEPGGRAIRRPCYPAAVL